MEAWMVGVFLLAVGVSVHSLSFFNYGRWCGKNRSFIFPKNKTGPAVCSCSDDVQTCRRKGPPIDALDDACMQHDFCVYCDKTSRRFHWCKCERMLVEGASRVQCLDSNCRGYRDRIISLFSNMPCYCKHLGKTCRRYFLFGADICLKTSYKAC